MKNVLYNSVMTQKQSNFKSFFNFLNFFKMNNLFNFSFSQFFNMKSFYRIGAMALVFILALVLGTKLVGQNISSSQNTSLFTSIPDNDQYLLREDGKVFNLQGQEVSQANLKLDNFKKESTM